MNLIFLDTETTGLNTDPNARLCQLAYKVGDEIVNELFCPPVPIGLGAMAVHHITQAMVNDKPAFKDTEHWQKLDALLKDKNNVVIAHNAKFDLEMLRREGLEAKNHICSLTLARHLFKGTGQKKHDLQTLRYQLGVDLDVKAHDAQGDVEVLEQVFLKLKAMADEKGRAWAATKNKKWSDKQSITRMIELSLSSVNVYSEMPFGKYAGTPLKELVIKDRRYCEWLVGNAQNPSDETVGAIRALLNQPK